MDYSTSGEDRGYITKDLNICLITFSTIFIALRCYVRKVMLNTIGWDDGFAILAWAILIVQSALEICEVNAGSGRHIQDVPPSQLATFFTLLPTMELLYFIATCFVRLSVVAVLPRISKEKKVMKIVWALGFFIVAMSLVCFFILLFSCKHIPDLWNSQAPGAQCFTADQQSHLFWSHAAVGVVVDIALLFFPIWLIYSRMMHSVATVKVLLVFGVGFFVLITGVVRLAIIVTTDYAIDTTWALAKLSIWADLEGHIGLWVACFPSLQPILRLAAKKMGLGSKNVSKDDVAVNSNNWENKARGYVKSGQEVNLGGEQNFVFDDDSSTKKIIMVDERDVGMEMEMGRVQAGRVQAGRVQSNKAR